MVPDLLARLLAGALAALSAFVALTAPRRATLLAGIPFSQFHERSILTNDQQIPTA